MFRRTHDIAERMDLLEDAGLAASPHADHLAELDPYAVEMRYGLVEPGDLARAATGLWIRDVIASPRPTPWFDDGLVTDSIGDLARAEFFTNAAA